MILNYLKFASQLNSKHFLTGQKKSALTSFRFSREATMYAGLAIAFNMFMLYSFYISELKP